MDFTPIARPYFSRIDRHMRQAVANPEGTQRRTLADLLQWARDTEAGARYGFGSIRSYQDFARRVPVVTYEDIHNDIERMIRGQKDILLPGRVRRFAQSSGTSDGRSKYIPLPRRSLERCHMRGGSEVVARYLAHHPDSRLFGGKSFILGGSYANGLNLPGVKAGDLSASLIDCINPLTNRFRVPSKDIALMADWNLKLDRLAESTLRADVRSLSGVPSWFYTVLRRVMDKAGATELHQVWPGLEVFFHGGISFAPYRGQYDGIIDRERMRYMETYNASEGFFALQQFPGDRGMLLLMDVDVFYEFVELTSVCDGSYRAHPVWEVESGRTYALAVTSSNGLWRYLIGDTVTVVSTDPVKIVIAGRTKSYINAFGEEVMVHNADAAVTAAARASGAEVADYTAAPVFADGRTKGYHQWLVEFNRAPRDAALFATTLDETLRQVNSDYDAKRTSDLFLSPPQVTAVPRGTFDRYLAATGKLGGQRKVPRLNNDRSVADPILELLKNTPQK